MIIDVYKELVWLNESGDRWWGNYYHNGEHIPYPFIKTKDVVICINLDKDYKEWFEVYVNEEYENAPVYVYSSKNLTDCLEWCNKEYNDIFDYYNGGVY